MTEERVQRLRESFGRLEEQTEIASLVFYHGVFTLAPELRPLFTTSIEVQGRKLMASLRQIVAAIERREELDAVLEALGRRHATYGAREEHYAIIEQALLRMLAEVLGPEFTRETALAWEEALEFVSVTMLRGARAVVAVAGGQRGA